MAKKQKKETFTATLPDGRTMEIPVGLTGSKLAAYVQSQLEQEAAEAATAAALQQEEQNELQQLKVEMANLRVQMSEQAQLNAKLVEQNEKLKQVSPDAAAGAMALMNATAQAQELRRALMSDMGAISEWRQKYNEDVAEVAGELRKRNRAINEQVEDRRRQNRIFFDQMRIQQGLEPQHPELLEQPPSAEVEQ